MHYILLYNSHILTHTRGKAVCYCDSRRTAAKLD